MDENQRELERREKLSEVADNRVRDEKGHFIHINPNPVPSPQTNPSSNPVTNFLHQGMSVNSTDKDDTLVDVHVNNPLRKITHLLEEIKKQKAFSFNIKGSLGLAGVVIALTAFGIFGGTKAFCSKGEQSHVGVMKVLNLKEDVDNSIVARAMTIWDAMVGKPDTREKNLSRVVLIEQNQVIYHLIGLSKEQRNIMNGMSYIVTGNVDSCTQTITVKNENAVQPQ